MRLTTIGAKNEIALDLVPRPGSLPVQRSPGDGHLDRPEGKVLGDMDRGFVLAIPTAVLAGNLVVRPYTGGRQGIPPPIVIRQPDMVSFSPFLNMAISYDAEWSCARSRQAVIRGNMRPTWYCAGSLLTFC